MSTSPIFSDTENFNEFTVAGRVWEGHNTYDLWKLGYF